IPQNKLEMLPDALREANGHSIPNLSVLGNFTIEYTFPGIPSAPNAAGCSLALERIPVRKELQSCPFANREDPGLREMNVVVGHRGSCNRGPTVSPSRFQHALREFLGFRLFRDFPVV